MAEQVKNTFEGGINSDLSPTTIPASSYQMAVNLSLVGDGKFGALQNLKGTTVVNSLLSSTNTEVLGVFNTRYKIGTTENVNCQTIITATSGGQIKIICSDLDNNNVYVLYSESTPADYFAPDRVIDGIVYSESGLDILYFTDNYSGNGIRKVRCEVPLPYTPNFLTLQDITLLKKTASGTITLTNVTTGGSLLSGTYQLAYQLINPTKNQYTRFSLLTNPLHVYSTKVGTPYATGVGGNLAYAGIGLPTNKKLVITITPTDDELASFTHFRLAIVENTNPEGVVTTDIGLGPITPIASLAGYEITSNLQIQTESLDNIVIDLAAIDRVKTIEVSSSRLLAGNVHLKDLSYNNGTPSITGGTIIRQSASGDSFSSELFSSNYKGYFRDEVYRFAIAYFDKDGFFSAPSVLDMSAVTFNQIGGGLTDFRFPSRNQVISGTYFTPLNTSNQTESLGLQLSGVNNHPKWARGFVILRAKRIKRIKFQTPLIPMSGIYGIGAIGTYPQKAKEGPGATPAYMTYTGTTPMGPATTWVPMNLFLGAYSTLDTIETITSTGVGALNLVAGENAGHKYPANTSSLFYIYPPDNLYSQTPYTFAGNETVKVIDAATCRLYATFFDGNNNIVGSVTPDMNLNGSGSFYATRNQDYYYYSGHLRNSPTTPLEVYRPSRALAGYKIFDNATVGTTLNGKFIQDFTKLTTGGLNWGIAASSQRGVAIELSDKFQAWSPPLITSVFGAGGSAPFLTGIVKYATPDLNGNPSGNFPLLTTSTGDYAFNNNVIDIASVYADVDDSRYGKTTEIYDYIYTGTKVVFTTAELTTVQAGGSLPKTVDVWGGDCIVSPHTFKIADTAYYVTNAAKGNSPAVGMTSQDAITAYGRAFNDLGDTTVLRIPVPVKGLSQYLTVVLESEHHGSVRDIDTYDYMASREEKAVYGAANAFKIRTSLTYASNINLKKENDQKIFTSIDPTLPVNNHYKARIYYSDIKVYQTFIEGFDTIRVANTFDLQERFGGLTKIKVSSDNMYGLQEGCIVYLPNGERIIEVTAGSQLGVRSGDIIGKPVFLDTLRGCQHLRSVVDAGDSFFLFDNRNKGVYKISNQSLSDITNKGFLTIARSAFSSSIDENKIVSIYDPNRESLWLAHKDGTFCYAFNEKFGCWTSNYTFPAGLSGGGFIKNNLHLVGNTGTNFENHSMHTGNPNQLFGTYVSDAYIDMVVNPAPDFPTVFDDLLFTASDRLSTVDITVERESGLGNQSASGINIDVTTRGEGNYRVKTLRDAAGARLRGLYAKLRIHWHTGFGSQLVSMYSVLTSYRKSY